MLEETMREWGQKMRQEGRNEGRQEAREEERQKGRKEAQAEMRKLILELIRDRFGPVPQAVRQRVQEISSLPELGKVARRVLTASSLMRRASSRNHRSPE